MFERRGPVLAHRWLRRGRRTDHDLAPECVLRARSRPDNLLGRRGSRGLQILYTLAPGTDTVSASSLKRTPHRTGTSMTVSSLAAFDQRTPDRHNHFSNDHGTPAIHRNPAHTESGIRHARKGSRSRRRPQGMGRPEKHSPRGASRRQPDHPPDSRAQRSPCHATSARNPTTWPRSCAPV